MHSTAPSLYSHSPFLLENEVSYQRWRHGKLNDYPVTTEDLIVEVTDPRRLSAAEIAEMLRICHKTNMVIYASPLGKQEDKAIPRRLGEQFGLHRLDSNSLADDDGITSLRLPPVSPPAVIYLIRTSACFGTAMGITIPLNTQCVPLFCTA